MQIGRAVIAMLVAISAIDFSDALAQGRGGNWPTTGGDPQRTSWMRTETRISAATLREGSIQLLWKRRLEVNTRDGVPLSQPLLLQTLISHKGFKALAFISTNTDEVHAIDYDLSKTYWKTHLSTAVAKGSDRTCSDRAVTITKAVSAGAAAAAGRGAAGRAGGAGPVVGINPNNAPITNAIYAVSSGGMVHALNPHVGEDLITPAKLLSPNARAIGSVLADNVLYVATEQCGNTPSGLWAIDLGSESRTVTTWDAGGANIVGAAEPAFGNNGVLYLSTEASGSANATYSNAIVALEPRTLKVKDWFAAPTSFGMAPVVFPYQGRDLIASGARDGRVYLVSADSLGGPDHRTALATSAPISGGITAGALATWEDAGGTRWLLVPSSADVTALRVVDRDGRPTFEQAWMLPMLTALSPLIMNDVAFVLAAGDSSRPAVLYALDAATGKELWNSGTAIATSVRGVGPSGADGQVYVTASDGTLYAFGIPLEH